MNDSTLPGCIGYFEAPLPPNGPCGSCKYQEVCRHVRLNFVPKAKLKEVLVLVQEVWSVLKEGSVKYG